MHLLALSGSLRAASSNTALVHAVSRLSPASVTVTVYDGLSDLPHFNPDREEEQIASVAEWRAHLNAAQGVIFSTPEYAHGLPGVLKNALDWVVGSGEFMSKPFTLFNASPHSRYAPEQLIEIVKTMDAQFIAAASVTLPLRGKGLNADGIIADSEIADALREALRIFVEVIQIQTQPETLLK